MRTTMKVMWWCGLVVAAGVLVAPAAAADEGLRDHPGYVPLEEMDVFGTSGPSVDVDLRGPMLKLVVAATEEDEPELSRTLDGILRIRVLAGEELGDAVQVRNAILSTSQRLQSSGWSRMVQVAEDDEVVIVLTRERGNRLAGLTVLMAEDQEASLVNLVGDIDPAMIGRLVGSLEGMPDLDDLALGGGDPASERCWRCSPRAPSARGTVGRHPPTSGGRSSAGLPDAGWSARTGCGSAG